MIYKKRAALELSIGTIVVLVLAMSMLILGLILVRTIFSGATSSVKELDDKVRTEITNLFADENANVIIKLGSDKTAKVKANNEIVSIVVAAKTIDGTKADAQMKYILSLDDGARDNCVSQLGKKDVEQFIIQKINTPLSFDEYGINPADTAYAYIEIQIPEGTLLCSQKVFIDVSDDGQSVGRALFKVEVIRKGFF